MKSYLRPEQDTTKRTFTKPLRLFQLLVVYALLTYLVIKVVSLTPVAYNGEEVAAVVREPNQLASGLDDCLENAGLPKIEIRGKKYKVLYKYIRPDLKFRCNESITYTTHSEVHYLHNLEPLLHRWQGPVSIAVFTPGSDYQTALDAVFYYRQCRNGKKIVEGMDDPSLVKKFVTFHFFYPLDHAPSSSDVGDWKKLLNFSANCGRPPPNADNVTFGFLPYRSREKLVYPINLGRNVAKESADTHFVFPSDIELYPSPGLIPKFLAMIRSTKNKHHQLTSNNTKPRVYVNAIFEVKKGLEPPTTKDVLLQYLDKGDAVTFHEFVCRHCHIIPGYMAWKELPTSDTYDVSHSVKRKPPFQSWEPIYIGTRDDPKYDERLSWDGRAEKMSQSLALCALDYDFMILDNAFLVHRSGIKTKNASLPDPNLQAAQSYTIREHVIPEMKRLYGNSKGCFTH